MRPQNRKNYIKDVIDTTFTVEHDSFGVIRREHKPGGSNFAVTEDSIKECVRPCYLFYAALQKGITEVIPHHLLKPFDEGELKVIVDVLGTIAIDDWKCNARLEHSSHTSGCGQKGMQRRKKK
ncbi:E3 ubiquitin-protein ligase SMURF2-like [Penaeus vannamei]|uniref:E3 ubiquitin-protein ligase SMURF2-like n=1 Tax=Penaeus vannamei TaxID=6689 RepID=UPI00387FA560